MRNTSRIIKHAIRFAATFAAMLIGTTYIFVGSAIAGAGDNKKVEVVKPEVVKVEVVKPEAVKAEAVKAEAVKAEAASGSSSFFARPFFFRPFFFDADDIFFGD